MLKKVSFLYFFLFFLLLAGRAAFAESALPAEQPVINTIEPITKEDRILILAPHPDDEAIACAGIIQEALRQAAQLKILYLTNGDHNEFAFIVYEKRLIFRQGAFIHLGEVRRKESVKAMKLLGLDENQLIFLGYPDFGTFTMFTRYWQTDKPYRSILTRISSVPYKENFSYGSPYFSQNILSDIKKVLLVYRPNKIFVSHPADTNPDHRAFYLFLQIALRDLRNQMPIPKIYPYLVHCIGWPTPRHYHPSLVLSPPKQFTDNQVKWSTFDLNKEQLKQKHQAILCYRSQTQSGAFYLLAFARKNELFSDYPPIELYRQHSLKEKAINFFGFSDLYPDSEVGTLQGLNEFQEDKGVVSYAVVDNFILVRMEKSKDIKSRFSLMVYFFGYSAKTPFAQMPKICIVAKYKNFKIFKEDKLIETKEVQLEVNPNVVILKVPLGLLGNPDFILASVKAYGGSLPFDATGFRRIDIKANSGS